MGKIMSVFIPKSEKEVLKSFKELGFSDDYLVEKLKVESDDQQEF